jgi:uncharacterized protein YecE (DUF72 family)
MRQHTTARDRKKLLRIGTSGWNYPHWREVFYPSTLPQADWFGYYSRLFDTVEINNTFYQLPQEKTFDHWREQAPAGFVYAVKANRYLTHQKKLKDAAEPLCNFLSRVRRLQSRLGPILYQLPPNWNRNVDRLAGFCRLLPKDLTHVFEFRNRDWLVDETYAVLEEHGACLCIHDMLPRHPRRVTASTVYVRMHGAGERYGGSYSRDRLRRWAGWIQEMALEKRRVYVYFNNDARGNAVRNALTLRECVGL